MGVLEPIWAFQEKDQVDESPRRETNIHGQQACLWTLIGCQTAWAEPDPPWHMEKVQKPHARESNPQSPCCEAAEVMWTTLAQCKCFLECNAIMWTSVGFYFEWTGRWGRWGSGSDSKWINAKMPKLLLGLMLVTTVQTNQVGGEGVTFEFRGV